MEENDRSQTRRELLRKRGAAALTSAMSMPMFMPAKAFVGKRRDTLKVGLIGCGGRGTGAAVQALHADPDVTLTAMGDVYKSKIDSSLAAIKSDEKVAARAQVKPENMFVGLDCYKAVIDSGVDVVLLASPPGFRPREIMAAVEAGKHIFAEKPMGTDAVNVRKAMEAAKAVDAKKLSFVAGFCWRYEPARRELYKRIHDGAVGEIRHIHATYLTGPVKPMPPASARPAGMSDVEWQIANWYNFVWLSGDGLVEQACHSVDKILWAMKDTPPLKCTGTGGRVNPNNEGNIFDHIDVFYEWPGGMRATMAQRQIPGCPFNENADYIAGEKGFGVIKGRVSISGAVNWTYDGPGGDMYQIEHNEFFASIRAGKPINDSHRMGVSTLAGIMGRMAAYTGAEVTWEHVLASQEDLFPKDLKWDGSLPIQPMAVPGKTPLV
jgi:predicted dehydrogenase